MNLQITAYFMGLATPHTEEVVNNVDKVGGFEWLIEKNEIDGGSALKPDLLLDTPIIIVPRNSMSREYFDVNILCINFESSGCLSGPTIAEKAKLAGLINGAHSILQDIKLLKEMHHDHSIKYYKLAFKS
ncbi:hypothetical protein POM88_019339 [Heracleum sosnowskyi]|uniref:Uncharacterized protein n=1 Tax=Heracleum sosnowskyi TaxID=360622 RepID=A0AAD8IT18_9APIA|nr:hypothetical protein POM88_019339 [Heracleum sosnowskyi]